MMMMMNDDAAVTAARCTTAHYSSSYSALSRGTSCLVVYADDAPLTWYEAAMQCVGHGAVLASFDGHTTADVSFVDASLVPADCAWIGLVKQFFYWTIVLRKYRSCCQALALTL